jgi:hypothetical protein
MLQTESVVGGIHEPACYWTSLATLKVDLSEATGSVKEQYDRVLLGYLCVSLVDKSRFGFVSHYIKVTLGQSGMCF